jgi:maleate isomerase
VIRLRQVPVELAEDRSEVRIGVIVPFDFALDREYWRYAPGDVTLHITRTPHVDEPLGIGLVEAVSNDAVIGDAVRDLVAPDPLLMVYACTSGSFLRGVAGEAHIRRVMRKAGARHAMTTSGALLDALAALDVRRVAVGTPYDEQVTAKLVDFLEESEVDVVSVACFGLHGDVDQVTPDSLHRLTTTADTADADAVFLSCTNLATFDVLADLERAVGKPVLSANQVTMWSALLAVDRTPDVDHELFRRMARAAHPSARTG